MNAADGVRLFLRGLRRHAAEQGDTDALAAVPFWKPVLVFEVGDFSRDKVSSASVAWDAARPKKASPFDDAEPACLWSSAGRPLLDRFARGADAVVVVVAPDCTLMGSFSVNDGDASESVRATLAEIFASDAARGGFDRSGN